jgi:PilZ domain
MPNKEQFADDENLGTGTEIRKQSSPPTSAESVSAGAGQKASRTRYPDMQSAVRFPIKLPISVKSKSGDNLAETQNISANGVLFQVDSEMPVGSMVDFTISLPAEVVGADANVQLDCRGRVVRNFEEDGRRGVGVVIDEYRFERR